VYNQRVSPRLFKLRNERHLAGNGHFKSIRTKIIINRVCFCFRAGQLFLIEVISVRINFVLSELVTFPLIHLPPNREVLKLIFVFILKLTIKKDIVYEKNIQRILDGDTSPDLGESDRSDRRVTGLW
jgi:hypothetical protein